MLQLAWYKADFYIYLSFHTRDKHLYFNHCLKKTCSSFEINSNWAENITTFIDPHGCKVHFRNEIPPAAKSLSRGVFLSSSHRKTPQINQICPARAHRTVLVWKTIKNDPTGCVLGAGEVCEGDRPAKDFSLFAFLVWMEMQHTGLSLPAQALCHWVNRNNCAEITPEGGVTLFSLWQKKKRKIFSFEFCFFHPAKPPPDSRAGMNFSLWSLNLI